MSIYIDNFETIYDTKGNIQALRNKVLDLAVRGKLVPQDPNEEPVFDLLKRIDNQKELLPRGTRVSRGKPIIDFSDDEIPFGIPDSWQYVRLSDITLYIKAGGDKPANFSKNKNQTYKYPVVANGIQNDGIIGYTDVATVNDPCITVSGRGTIGYSSIRKEPFTPIVRLLVLNILKEVSDRYIQIVLTSLLERGIGTSIPQLTVPMIEKKLIPLPPLAEQRRIVAKVESLMAEIDKLEEYLQNKEHLMGLLPQAVVDAIGDCKNGEELKEQLQFVISNFETIFQTPESMQDLRNVILQLAIEGKLVPQDPSDEPASELIKRIKTEKEELVKDGKIKKQAAIKPIETDEIPFEIPSNWEWVRLGGITNYGENITLAPEKVDSNAWVLELEDIEKNSSRILSVIYNKDRKTKSNKNQFHKGDVLYGKLRPYLKKILVAPDDGVCTTEIVAFRGYCDISSDYLVAYLKSAFVDNHINNLTYGIKMPRLGTDDAIELLVPLPPLREQLHIISKVESIMSFIDQMEAKMKLKLDLVEKMAST